MSLVHGFADFLRVDGLDVLFGTTLVLGAFVGLILCTRSLVQKRRLAGLAMMGILAFGVAIAVPMPRWSWSLDGSLGGDATVAAAQPVSVATRPAERHPAMTPSPAMRSATATGVLPAPDHDLTTAVPATVRVAEIPQTDWALVAAWTLLLGSALVALHLALGWWRLRRILAASSAAPPELRVAAAIPEHVQLRISNRRVQPFCCGVVRGWIVLPPDLDTSSAEAVFVARHEAAHLSAGDMRLRVLAALLRPLLFWQPLYWWLQGQLRFTGEVLADDAAAAGAVPDYVRSMVALASNPAPSVPGGLAASAFYRSSELYRRLQMMLQRKGSLSTFTSPWRRLLHGAQATAIVACSALFFGVEPMAAQDPVPDPAREKVLRSEVQELRNTIRALREELRALRPGASQLGGGAADLTAGKSTAGKPTAGTHYRVRAGDSLASIAREVYGSEKRVNELIRRNPQVDPRRLRVGALLRIAGPVDPVDFAERVEPAGTVVASRSLPNERARATEPSGSTSSRPDLGGIADLVTRSIELGGQVRIAEIERARAEESMKAGHLSRFDVEIAAINLDTRKRQYRALHKLLEREIENTEREFKQLSALHEGGRATEREVANVAARLEMLRSGL